MTDQTRPLILKDIATGNVYVAELWLEDAKGDLWWFLKLTKDGPSEESA